MNYSIVYTNIISNLIESCWFKSSSLANALRLILAMKKFRNRGNKTGAIGAFYKLEDEKLCTMNGCIKK